MGIESGRKSSRRDFLIGASATTILTACDAGSILQSGQDRKEDKENGPQMGDVIVVDGRAYKLRVKKKFPIPDLNKYLEYTKHRGRVLNETPQARTAFNQYPMGLVPKDKTIFDIYSGDPKNPKPLGGELNCYGGGFITEDGIPQDGFIRPKNIFVPIKTKLEENGFTFMDNFLLTWGKKLLDGYDAMDTAKDPEKSIGFTIEQIEWLAEMFPLAQQNWIVHSLAGVIIVGAFIKRPDLINVINNLILLSVPIRGFDFIQRNKIGIAKQLLKDNFPISSPLLNDEKVTDYLSKINDSPTYKRELDKFGRDLRKSKKGFLIARTDNDPWVPTDSTIVEGADLITVSGSFNSLNPLTYLDPHGRTLRSELVIKETRQRIGKNLATA